MASTTALQGGAQFANKISLETVFKPKPCSGFCDEYLYERDIPEWSDSKTL